MGLWGFLGGAVGGLGFTLRLPKGSWAFWGRVWAWGARAWDLTTRVQGFALGGLWKYIGLGL